VAERATLIVAAYEKNIDDAVLFGFDLVRPVQLEITFEMLCCHRRYEDPVRLAGGFDAGGDVMIFRTSSPLRSGIIRSRRTKLSFSRASNASASCPPEAVARRE
jgi:hypothetical protein